MYTSFSDQALYASNVFSLKIRNPAKLNLIVVLCLFNIIYIIVSFCLEILMSLPNYFLFALGINWGILYFYFIIIKTSVLFVDDYEFKYIQSTTSIICCFQCFFQRLQKCHCEKWRWWISVRVVNFCSWIYAVICVSFALFGVASYFFIKTSYNTVQINLQWKV